MVEMKKQPYIEKINERNEKLRIFTPRVNDEELKWQRVS